MGLDGLYASRQFMDHATGVAYWDLGNYVSDFMDRIFGVVGHIQLEYIWSKSWRERLDAGLGSLTGDWIWRHEDFHGSFVQR